MITFKLECANCREEKDLSDNISLFRLVDEANEFYKTHRTRVGKKWCTRDNLFIRTFKVN